MFHIGTTRFNHATWRENLLYREKLKIPAIYGIDVPVRNTYDIGCWFFVFEMNNETNQIEGLGLVQNYAASAVHNIHRNYQYNYHIYQGPFWASRKRLMQVDADIVDIADAILFTKRSHLKRQTGITMLTNTIFKNWTQYSLYDLKQKVLAAYNKITQGRQQ